MINGALNKMTVAIGKIFRTTVQEMNQNKDNKVSENQTQQSRRTGVKQRRRRLPATDSKIDSESDSDEELTKTSGSSVSTRSIFTPGVELIPSNYQHSEENQTINGRHI